MCFLTHLSSRYHASISTLHLRVFFLDPSDYLVETGRLCHFRARIQPIDLSIVPAIVHSFIATQNRRNTATFPVTPRLHNEIVYVVEPRLVAAMAMLDEAYEFQLPAVHGDDDNSYTFWKIGEHNVVIAALPSGEWGTVFAAVFASDMSRSFDSCAFVFK